ncbi:winged helix-turn-helix transcriptional regulator [Dactylosporangium aurantiacum]|uniref:Winged helix-turn-helix transcriptional regulator n=1 Tax=Dactylosporangium aurantiacum TaxID=35754 RepID=A0A9Q9IKN1_9ACTN|nr:metalloregulator ArsR/SmtB family transcription factor [Dactylosporangium aurantiacum]MDG6106146.1 metalloregulator ArsR/SmtB family transcription factor [Dactylosporangium aurantiacum]UWZ55820.1 winged helix-turn-helix transcriptional regulator [Dactylosporangium aurantiacum]
MTQLPPPTAAPAALHGPTQDFLKALASETRQQIMLLFTGGAELTVGEVAECCGLGQSTTSEQLAVLRRGGLVQSTRDGKLVRYRADPAAISARLNDLQTYLACCCPPPAATLTTSKYGEQPGA